MKTEHRKTLVVGLIIGIVGLLFVLFNKVDLTGATGAASVDTTGSSGSPVVFFVLLGVLVYGILTLITKGFRS
ncbi:TPA: hypothetical protein HA249_04550 [Candidatus Woesearchaeota archaeon]|nr:MAG: hypothetical protein QT07_C0002G0041 [archaeon GW2011_AR16]HIG96124.1 hypothetical protein [Candidatus Woesearchaeota archaeon]HIH47012.1 hypothetical protein [Candidatus Woesearchaeota archaeon]HII89238.1 hypothetical protein [Candidatus Woesearchaeota archaeon]